MLKIASSSSSMSDLSYNADFKSCNSLLLQIQKTPRPAMEVKCRKLSSSWAQVSYISIYI